VGASPKCSSKDRARTDPTPSIRFKAMNASREFMRVDNGSPAARQELFQEILQPVFPAIAARLERSG
jgi:hypothetical protein